MKTNNPRLTKEEKQELKQRHRLDCVMQESGERFEADSKTPNLWRSITTPGLVVDVDRQTFTSPTASGDVFAWLMRRNGWTFPQALRFLQKRRPDPKRVEAAPAPREHTTPKTTYQANDYITISHEYIDPATGARSYAARINDELMDKWQRRAHEIAGDRILKYFNWKSWDLRAQFDTVRIEPICYAPDIDACPRCEKEFNWNLEKEQIPVQHGYQVGHWSPLPVKAYAIKKQLQASDYGIESDEVCEALFNLWVEIEDGIICASCAAREIDFQKAIALVRQSAHRREEAQYKAERERDWERWREEERERERQEREAEAAYECDFAAPLP